MVERNDYDGSRVFELVQLALADQIGSEYFLTELYKTGIVDFGEPLPKFLHLTTHFISDADLRANDADYSTHMENEILSEMKRFMSERL